MQSVFRLTTWAVLYCSASLFASGGNMSLQPNPSIQSFLTGMLSTNENEMFEGNEDIFRIHLSRLGELSGHDETNLVCQLLYFSAGAKDMQEAMLPGIILKELSISSSAIAEGALALISNDQPALQAVVFNWLGGTDTTEDGKVDFSRYESILKNVPSSHIHENMLVRYMYDRDPLAASVTMARIYGDTSNFSELVSGLHDKQITTLQNLYNRQEWWVRLYVVEIMKKHPQLYDPVIYEQMQNDEHPFVRERAEKGRKETQ